MKDELTALREENERLKKIIINLLEEKMGLQAAAEDNDPARADANLTTPAANEEPVPAPSVAGNTDNAPSANEVSAKTLTPGEQVNLVSIHLKPQMEGCRESSVRKAATILLHLQHNPRNTYETLRSLTGLSVPGMAKHIALLKEQDLVRKHDYQHYVLTDKAKGILEKAAAMSHDDIMKELFRSRGLG